jgi:hypothetical protein
MVADTGRSQADDVARLRQVLARQPGPTLVAGHSYVAMVSHPDEVLQLIKTAAEAVTAAT